MPCSHLCSNPRHSRVAYKSPFDDPLIPLSCAFPLTPHFHIFPSLSLRTILGATQMKMVEMEKEKVECSKVSKAIYVKALSFCKFFEPKQIGGWQLVRLIVGGSSFSCVCLQSIFGFAVDEFLLVLCFLIFEKWFLINKNLQVFLENETGMMIMMITF